MFVSKILDLFSFRLGAVQLKTCWNNIWFQNCLLQPNSNMSCSTAGIFSRAMPPVFGLAGSSPSSLSHRPKLRPGVCNPCLFPRSCPRTYSSKVLKDRLCIACATKHGDLSRWVCRTWCSYQIQFTCVILDLDQWSRLVQQVRSPGDWLNGDLERLRMIHSVSV